MARDAHECMYDLLAEQRRAAEQQVVRAFWLVTAGLVGIGLLLLPIT